MSQFQELDILNTKYLTKRPVLTVQFQIILFLLEQFDQHLSW